MNLYHGHCGNGSAIPKVFDDDGKRKDVDDDGKVAREKPTSFYADNEGLLATNPARFGTRGKETVGKLETGPSE